MIRSRLRRRITRVFQDRLVRRGFDITGSVAHGRALILAPHADDEAIGCGVLVARKAAAGTDVAIVIATDGRHALRSREIGSAELARVRRLEAVAAAEAVGLDASAVRFLDFEDGTLAGQPDALATALREVIREWQPDEIYAPHADEHPDHRTLSAVAHAVAADAPTIPLYEYPVRYWERVPWVVRPHGRVQRLISLFMDPHHEWRRPPAALVRAEEFRERKLAALHAYAGEMRFVGHLAYPYAQAEFEVFFPANAAASARTD